MANCEVFQGSNSIQETNSSVHSPALHLNVGTDDGRDHLKIGVCLKWLHRCESRWRNSNTPGNDIDGATAIFIWDLRHLKIPFCKRSQAQTAFYRWLNSPLSPVHCAIYCKGICGSCMEEKKINRQWAHEKNTVQAFEQRCSMDGTTKKLTNCQTVAPSMVNPTRVSHIFFMWKYNYIALWAQASEYILCIGL